MQTARPSVTATTRTDKPIEFGIGGLRVFLVIAGLFLHGCGEPEPAKPSPTCQTRSDCADPCATDCVAHACVASPVTGCDDGNPCTSDDCSKAKGCSHLANAATCTDGNDCTGPDTCSSSLCVGGPQKACGDDNPCTADSCAAGACVHTPTNAACSDANLCTLGEACSAGLCVGGLAVNCDDGAMCTADTCDSKQGCLHAAGTEPCSDGDPCTSGDACANGKCAGKPLPCDDNNACTHDNCGVQGCEHLPQPGPCTDENVCTMGDTCLAGSCSGGAPLPCGDGNPCTGDSCDPSSGCSYKAQDGPCEDGDACTVATACQAGQCGGGSKLDCQDGNPCTQDACDASLGCVHVAATGECSDGNACTVGDGCGAGKCVPGATKPCGDGNPCTVDTCDPAIGCLSSFSSGPCDDGDVCSQGDACSAGTCKAGSALNCSDNKACTADSCDPLLGCLHGWLSGGCDDGNLCTSGEVCKIGACMGGAATNCSDGLDCTADSCDPAKGCLHLPLPNAATLCSDNNPCTSDGCSAGLGCTHVPAVGAVCSDGDPCTAGDTCVAGACQSTGKLTCNDSNPCTTDSCVTGKGCTFAVASGPCDDGNACTSADSCVLDQCKGGSAIVCQDGNPCTIDACKPESGCSSTADPKVCDDQNPCTKDSCSLGGGCSHEAQSGPCNDGDACTSTDACSGGFCVGTGGLLCSDGNPCTADSCDSSKGCIYLAIPGTCSDGNPCTQGDACQSGTCKGGAKVNCEDNNPCTADLCTGDGGCKNLAITGSCATGGTCLANGTCCIPNCAGKPCGGDGCGGSCGGCASGSTCTVQGKCIPSQCPGVSYQGCCDNNTLKYCENNTIFTASCAPPKLACGWDVANQYYSCSGGGADPSGQNPMACQVKCTAEATKGCCGQNLCWFDSCGNLGAVAQTCALGCDVAKHACMVDKCQGVPDTGTCLADGKTMATCFKPSTGDPQVVYSTCATSTTCKVVSGKAMCVGSGTCAPGSSVCDPGNPDVRVDCSSGGTSTSVACPGCVDQDSGAVCSKLATASLTMTWRYQYKVVNSQKTGWNSTPLSAPLAGALVVSRRPTAGGGSLTLGSGITDASGKVTLAVPAQPQLGDEIAVIMAHLSNHGAVLDYVVAEPDVGEGQQSPNTVAWGDHSVFSWTLPASQWKAGGEWLLTLDQGSAAAHAFDALQRAEVAHAKNFAKPGMTLAIWMRPNVTWTCGACFSNGLTAHIGGKPVAASLWMPWEGIGEEQWAIAVIDHELGHWTMSSWGTSPGEGGKHFIGTPTFPGQAWSEGFATWHSSAMRGDPLYFDVQKGSSFWVDLASRTTSMGKSIVPVSANGGILQKMDENLVAAWLWDLVPVGASGLATSGLQPLWTALASPRMTISPFARGYTRHSWQTVTPGVFLNVIDTLQPAPMVADFLDALLCKGFSASTVQSVLGVWAYNAAQPLCKVGGGP